MYKTPYCPPPACEPHRRIQPTWCGPADCTKPGDVYDIQHMKPPMPEPCPGPGYMIPLLRPELRNMTEAQQIQELIDRVDCMTKTFNEYSKNVFGAYEAVVNSATCNDAYYDEIKVQSGFITSAGISYKMIDIPFLDRADQPIYLELGLAYNNTQNMGVTEDILDASYRTIADKIVSASTGPYIDGSSTTGWDGIVYYGGAPISNPTHSVNYTIAALDNGFIKVYPNTTPADVMRNDRVIDAIGCMSVLVNDGVATPNLYGSDSTETKARVAIGMNYATKHRFIVVVDGTDTVGCTSADLSSIFLNFGCNVAAEVCTGAKAVGVDKGMFMYNPSTVNENGAPAAPQVCAFWFITKQRHYHNQYVRDVAELTQNVGKQTWQATVANKNVEGMWAEINAIRKDLTQETSDREAGDNALGERIDVVVEDLAQESADREAADETLDTKIAQETAAREEADTKHDSEIEALQQEDENIKSSYLPLAGGTMAGKIDMNNQPIDSVPAPTEPDHAANKQYVDAGDSRLQTQVNAKLPLSGGTMTGAIIMNGQAITGLPEPANQTDAVTKQYADNLKAQMLPSSGGTMTGAINMGNNTITALGAPVGDTDATNKEYVDGAITSAIKSAEGDADAKYLPLAGGTMTGAIKGLQNPTEDDEAANKAYVDAQVSGAGSTADGKYLALAGGTMTGPIAMSGQKITGAADPTDEQDVATKKYVDEHGGGGSGDYLPLTGGTMGGNINMSNHKITGLVSEVPAGDEGIPTLADDEAVGFGVVSQTADKAYNNAKVYADSKTASLESNLNEKIDQVDSDKLPLAGGNMSGDINMVGNTVTGLKAPVNDSDAVNLAYVKEHVPTGGYLPLEGGTMSGSVDMGNHTITSLQMPEGEDAGDAVNREFVKKYNYWYYKRADISSSDSGSINALTTEVGEGIYLLNVGFTHQNSTAGNIKINCTYPDAQKIYLGQFIVGGIDSQTKIFPGNCTLSFDITVSFTTSCSIQFTLIKIGDTGIKTEDSPWPLPATPTSDNLATVAVTQTALSLKKINYKVTSTPAEENNVFSGARVYYNTGSTANAGSRILIADLPSNLFSSNTYNGSFDLPAYNTQYYISVVSYYSGIEPELTKGGTGFAVTTRGGTPQPVTSFNVSQYSGTRVLAAWNNPADITNFNGVKIEYKQGNVGAWSPGTGTQVYQGTGTSAGAGQRSTVYVDLPALNTQYTLMIYTWGNLTGSVMNSTSVVASVTTSGPQNVNVTSGRSVTVPVGYSKVDVFLVGGGATGGYCALDYASGGGGGSGLTKTISNHNVTSGQTITCVIGAGGKMGAAVNSNSNGNTTSVSGAISGSANGGEYGQAGDGGNGGSGGGAGGRKTSGAIDYGGGNGGSNGGNGSTTNEFVDGGTGQGTSTRAFGDSSGTLYAGAGSGAGAPSSMANAQRAGTPGPGGGGKGAEQVLGNAPTAGSSNTGGGGGGGGSDSASSNKYKKAGNGGSGLVLFRFHN